MDEKIKLINKLVSSNKNNLIMLFFLLFLSCDETPPYVQIISPVEGAVMPSSISTIQAEAYDNEGDGKVVSVEFYVDGVLIGSDSNPNSDGLWEYPWNVSYWADSSDHSITAKAIDYSNNIGQSNIVTVMVPSGIEILPTLIQPELSEIIDYTNRPTFTWFGLQSTSNYEIEISKFSDIDDYSDFENNIEEHIEFENSFIDTTVTDTFFTVPFELADSTSAFYWHIRGENELGNISEWSETWVFKITGPDPPLLYSPIQETLYSLPTFTWLNSPSAYEYEIRVGKADICNGTGDLDNCFTNLAFSDTVDRDLGQLQEYMPDEQVSLLSGEHWWKVRSKNQNDIWGDWSEAKSFEISPPNHPTLISPINGEMITHSLQPDLTWELNDGSVLFQVQISKNNVPDFEDSIYIDINSLDSNLFDLENLEYFLDEGINYWRVKAANNTNAWSDWSDINQFRITGSLPPIIIDPHPDSIFTQYNTLIFNWEESFDADDIPAIMYQIQINYNESETIMKDVVIDDVSNLSYEFTDLSSFLYDQSYYRIRSKNSLNLWGDWSSCDLNELNEPLTCNSIKDYVRFYYQPDSPDLYYPVSTNENEIELLTQPMFSWESVIGADQYIIQLSSNQNNWDEDLIFEETVSNAEFNIENYNFESGNQSTLYWRVKSIVNTHSSDLTSEWSAIGEFSAIKPIAPELGFPIDGIVITENLQFEWEESQGAQKYQIIVSDNYTFNNNGTIINSISSGPYLYNFNLVSGDFEDGNYFWKVRTQSELGIWSEYSSYSYFEANSPPMPELNIPIDLDMLIEVDSLIWTSSIDLSQYEIEIVNQNSGEIFSDFTNDTYYTNISNVINNGTHYWRIRSQNNMAMFSQWTDPWYFWVPYNLDVDDGWFNEQGSISISNYPITTEQYVDFLNEAYYDSLEYIVTRNQYIKGYCDGMPDGEEYNFIKKATPSDISSYNLARIRWNNDDELFYFEGSNELVYDNHPMIFVTWCGAMAFVKHYNLDLPSIQEWQDAISISGWDNVDNSYVNYLDSGDPWDEPGGTTPVNFYQYPFSNLNDALGNVWEWTKNENDSGSSDRSCVGGSYLNPFEEISIESIRIIDNGILLVNKDVGFRVIKREISD